MGWSCGGGCEVGVSEVVNWERRARVVVIVSLRGIELELLEIDMTAAGLKECIEVISEKGRLVAVI